MFAYDPAMVAAVQTKPQTITGVLEVMQTIDATCIDADGLKWFNWLYLAVTQAIEAKVSQRGFNDPPWLAQLDVQFAQLYFKAVSGCLTGGACPACWNVM